jgi:flavin-binding protein dodecin
VAVEKTSAKSNVFNNRNKRQTFFDPEFYCPSSTKGGSGRDIHSDCCWNGNQKLRCQDAQEERRQQMTESVYKVIELVGSSPNSWEDAAKNAVEKAGESLRDLRVAEVSKLDMKVENGKVSAFRARVNLSFKYGGGE